MCLSLMSGPEWRCGPLPHLAELLPHTCKLLAQGFDLLSCCLQIPSQHLFVLS